MIGVPDYDTYVAHRRANHPDQPIMTYVEFFRERQQAREQARGDREPLPARALRERQYARSGEDQRAPDERYAERERDARGVSAQQGNAREGDRREHAQGEQVDERLREDRARDDREQAAVGPLEATSEHDHARGQGIEIHFLQDRQSVLVRHAQIEQKDVGLQLSQQLDALRAVLCFSDNGDVFVRLEELAQAITEDGVVIG